MVERALDPELWKLLSIPVVAGAIGWSTNWLAVQMTFWPLEFVGAWPPILGWQGIIPAKARKMASIAVDSTLSKLASLREIFDRMEPQRVAEHVIRTVEPRLDEYVAEIMREQNPKVWQSLPPPVKEAVFLRVRQQLPRLASGLIVDIRERIEELMDLKDMVIRQLVRDRTLLTRMFLECGAAELRFVVNSGLWFGLLFGVPQMVLWIFYKGWWVLPVAGLVVGYVTNWLALHLIFEPLEPKKIGPFVLQGLFLRRQKEVAATYCRLVTREVLTVRNFVDAMLNGPKGDRTQALIRRHVKRVVDDLIGVARPAVELAVGPAEYARLKESVAGKALAIARDPFDDPVFNEERAAVVEQVTRERMESMTPAEFQDLLRPAFHEDEYKLILVGAVLGFAAGLGQLVLVFGGIQ
ncbi:MAG: hypothetical protein ACREQY_11425 [Candidatus Binatia bacterium]